MESIDANRVVGVKILSECKNGFEEFELKSSVYRSILVRYMSEVSKYDLLSIDEEKIVGERLNRVRKESLHPHMKDLRSLVRARYKMKREEHTVQYMKGLRKLVRLIPVVLDKSKKENIKKRLDEYFKTGSGRYEKKFKKIWMGIEEGNEAVKIVVKPLVVSNLRLVINIARQYNMYNKELSIEDLIQEGNIGLMRAARTWDVRESKFATYAYYWIRQTVHRAITDKDDQVLRFPVHITERVRKIIKRRRELEQKLLRYPTDEETAKDMDIPVEKIREALAFARLKNGIISLDAPVGENKEDMLGWIIGDKDVENPLDVSVKKEVRDKINAILSDLTPREAKIIKARYGIDGDSDGKVLNEVGLDFGVCRERIRQIQDKALSKLKHPARVEKIKELIDEK